MAVELPESLDVIAVGAHPDDVEIACGGTLAKLVQQGYRVGIIDLTDGEPTPLSPGPEVRAQEAKDAAEILGVHVRENVDLPNRKLFDCYEARVALAKVFRRYRPKIVMGIAQKTPMASPDHWQAMQITDAAVFYSRLTKWDSEFDNLPVHTIKSLVWYPLTPRYIPQQVDGSSFIVDITDTYELKLKSIRAYSTQFPPEKEPLFKMLESKDRMLGASAGFEFGEMFIKPNSLGVTDFVKTVLPNLDS